MDLKKIYYTKFEIQVYFNLTGEMNETNTRELNEDKANVVLKQSSVDSFIMSVKK